MQTTRQQNALAERIGNLQTTSPLQSNKDHTPKNHLHTWRMRPTRTYRQNLPNNKNPRHTTSARHVHNYTHTTPSVHLAKPSSRESLPRGRYEGNSTLEKLLIVTCFFSGQSEFKKNLKTGLIVDNLWISGG